MASYAFRSMSSAFPDFDLYHCPKCHVKTVVTDIEHPTCLNCGDAPSAEQSSLSPQADAGPIRASGADTPDPEATVPTECYNALLDRHDRILSLSELEAIADWPCEGFCSPPAKAGSLHIPSCPAVNESYDYIQKPPHYTWHPWIEAADLATYFGYNIGTAMTYLFRLGHKPQHEDKAGDEQVVQDIRKAIRHLQFEVNRIEGRRPSDKYPYDC